MTPMQTLQQNVTVVQANGISPNHQTSVVANDHRANAIGGTGGFQRADPGTGERVSQNSRFEPTGRKAPAASLDRALLARAEDLLDDIENAALDDQMLAMESMRCVVCQLWPSALKSSLQHRSLLAMIQAFIAGRDSLAFGSASALRGAIMDLASRNLTEQHLDIIRSGLIDEGHNPLVAFTDLVEGDALPREKEIGVDDERD